MSDVRGKTITSVLGHEYPMTMMGFQAADMDAAVLAERQRHKPWYERLRRRLTRWELRLWGPRDHFAVGDRLTLQATCLVLARTEAYEGGRGTWYPLHVRWAWSRRGRPHFHVQRERRPL